MKCIDEEWTIADGWLGDDPRFDGWYIVRPDGEYAGPFTEDEAAELLPRFKRRYDKVSA